MSSVRSISLQNCGISSKYLQANNYLRMKQSAKLNTIAYLDFCKAIEQSFQILGEFSDSLGRQIKINNHEKYQYVHSFKSFLNGFLGVISKIALYKLNNYIRIKEKNEDETDTIIKNFLEKASSFQQTQKDYLKTKDTLQTLKQQLREKFQQAMESINNPYEHYNFKFMNGLCRKIGELAKQRDELTQKLNEAMQQIRLNSSSFQRQLIFLKHNLFNLKCLTIQKLEQQSQNSKQHLVELLVFMQEEVNEAYKEFFGQSSSIKSKHRLHSGDFDNISSTLIQSTQQYQNQVGEIEFILQSLITQMLKMQEKIKHEQEQTQKISAIMHQIYDTEECDICDVLDVLELFSFFIFKLTDLTSTLNVSLNNLALLRKNVKKHSSVALSLIKFDQNHRQQPGKEIEQLYNQMSHDYIKEILKDVINNFKECLSNIKNSFKSKLATNRKQNIENSMELSYLQNEKPKDRHKPSKAQEWLYKNWKDDKNFVFVSFPQRKEIKEFISRHFVEPGEEKETMKAKCQLVNKKNHKGILKLAEKHLLFVSSSRSLELFVPYASIVEANVIISTFKKQLLLSFSSGELVFQGFIDIYQVHQRLEQKIQEAAEGINNALRPTVILTANELEAIANKRNQIMKSIEPLDTYELKQNHLFQGLGIDHLYQLIFSDNEVCIKGTTYPSFQNYVLNRSKKMKVNISKYNPPGPNFYTLNQEVTFENGPMVSQKIATYETPLPPMPMMPSFCSCQDLIKIYWLSHEELYINVTARTFGIKFADTFYVKIIYHLLKEGTGVRLKIYSQIVFVKDSFIKGMLKSKGQEELNNNLAFWIKECIRYIKTSTGGNGKEEAFKDEEIEEENPQENPIVAKLQKQKKYLLIGFIILVLINVLWKIIEVR